SAHWPRRVQATGHRADRSDQGYTASVRGKRNTHPRGAGVSEPRARLAGRDRGRPRDLRRSRRTACVITPPRGITSDFLIGAARNGNFPPSVKARPLACRLMLIFGKRDEL